jgi:hypothetical protein
MNSILQNIIDGTVFNPKRSNNELIKNIHYISKTASKRAMAADFKKALVAYNQTRNYIS